MKKIVLVLLALTTLASGMGFAQGAKDGGKAVLDNIFSRKSVRTYTEQPVSDAQVETILRAAMAAKAVLKILCFHNWTPFLWREFTFLLI